MVERDEVERRNRYWFENWQSFTCPVTVSVPERRQAQVGLFGDGLFGSIPIPYRSRNIEPGQFSISEGCLWVSTADTTYCWPIEEAKVQCYPEGAEVRMPNQPVVTIRGPVAAPILGAYHAAGRLVA